MVCERIKSDGLPPLAWVGFGGGCMVTGLALSHILPLGKVMRESIGWGVGVGGLAATTFMAGWSSAPKRVIVVRGKACPEGAASRPVRGVVGIYNGSNACYFNTSMQLLALFEAEIRAARSPDIHKERLRRKIVALYDERDRILASGERKAIDRRFVEEIMTAANTLRQRMGEYDQAWTRGRQNCVRDVTEFIMKVYGLSEISVDPFARFEESMRTTTGIMRYDFGSFDFLPVDGEDGFAHLIRRTLRTMQAEYKAGEIKAQTLRRFVAHTNTMAKCLPEAQRNAFAEQLEMPHDASKWDIAGRLAFAFWQLGLRNPFPQPVGGFLSKSRLDESPTECLERFNLSRYKEKFQECPQLLQIADDHSEVAVTRFVEWTDQLGTQYANDPKFRAMREEEDVNIPADQKEWKFQHRIAVALWHQGLWDPAPPAVPPPTGTGRGYREGIVVNMVPPSPKGRYSIQQLADRSHLKADLRLGHSLQKEPPPILQFYVQRFVDGAQQFNVSITPEPEVSFLVGGDRVYYEFVGAARKSGGYRGGHYIALVKHEGQWVRASDSDLTAMTLEQVQQDLASSGYLFFYKRKGEESSL